MTKTTPRKKKCNKAKWLCEEALQIAEERREVKGKGEREKYTQLNAEFQRIARRDKKAFLNEQCKETEENDKLGRTKELFKKTGDSRETFHARMSTVKEAGNVKKWRERTEELEAGKPQWRGHFPRARHPGA